MVQAEMTHQAVADHCDVSRITISRLMIRLRQTGRTNGSPCNGRRRVMSQRQHRHIRLIQLRKSMTTTEDTTRRTSGLANVRISSRQFAEDHVNLDSELDVRWQDESLSNAIGPQD
jgi:transposase